MRNLITLKKTRKINFSGEIIYKTDAGPYKYACQNEDLIEANGAFIKVRVLNWCSSDGEPIMPIDANKYDIKGE